jgi:hypothetical protein
MRDFNLSAFARLLSYGPWPSTVLGPPKAAVWDVTPSESAGITRVVTIEEKPNQLPASQPRCPDDLKSRLIDSLFGDVKALQVIELAQGRYVPGFLAVLDRSDRMLHDYTQLWQPGARNSNVIFNTCVLPRVRELPGLTLLLDTPGHGRNYYHWLIEGGARIAAMEAAGYPLKSFDRFLLSSPRRGYHHDCLESLGIDPAKVVCPRELGGHVRCERLVTSTDAREYLYETTRRWLRANFLPEIKAGAPARIYISRNDAPTRRVANETALLERLVTLGFVVVKMNGLTIREQAGLFAGAEVIVAPHGAALANLVFCRAGVELVELQSPTYAKGLFWRVADGMQVGYTAVEGVSVPDSSRQPMDLDQDCNIDAVITEVVAAIGRVQSKSATGVSRL